MKRLVARTAWVLLPVVLTAMAGRLVWHASRTQTGLELLRAQWRDGTAGLIAGRRTPVVSRPPTDQAAFWLGEVERVLAEESDNSDLAAGAAVVLDGPAWGFTSKYLWNVHLFYGIYWFPSDDPEDAVRAFESLCQAHCLSVAAAATRSDPGNVERSRLRALLLVPHPFACPDRTPRDPRWLETLEECARHDPDNALYDYLAAYFYWRSSELGWPWTENGYKVADAERFARGVERFEQGQAKQHFAMGDRSDSALFAFLTRSSLPKTQYVHQGIPAFIAYRQRDLLRALCRWQAMHANEEETAGRFGAALAIRRQTLRLIDQITSGPLPPVLTEIALELRVATTGHMRRLAGGLADPLPTEELASICLLEEEARLDREVQREAERRRWQEQAAAHASRGPSDWVFGHSSLNMIFARVAVGMLPSFAVVLLVAGGAAIALSSLSRRRDLPRVRLPGHVLALTAAGAITVVLFALAPAEIISGEVQAWVLTSLLILAPVGLVSWLAWRWLRRRAFKFSLRTMLISTSAVCALLALAPMITFDTEPFRTFPFALSMPGGNWEGGDAQAGGKPFRLRDRLGAWCNSMGRPLVVCAATALFVYLALAPQVIDHVERETLETLAILQQPRSDEWAAYEDAVQRVRSDPALMQQLTNTVRQEMSAPSPTEPHEPWSYDE